MALLLILMLWPYLSSHHAALVVLRSILLMRCLNRVAHVVLHRLLLNVLLVLGHLMLLRMALDLDVLWVTSICRSTMLLSLELCRMLLPLLSGYLSRITTKLSRISTHDTMIAA